MDPRINIQRHEPTKTNSPPSSGLQGQVSQGLLSISNNNLGKLTLVFRFLILNLEQIPQVLVSLRIFICVQLFLSFISHAVNSKELDSDTEYFMEEGTRNTRPLQTSRPTSPRHLRSESPSPTLTTSSLATLFFDAVEYANPPIRQLASHATYGSSSTGATSELQFSRSRASRGTSEAAFDKQRHPGKTGACPMAGSCLNTSHSSENGGARSCPRIESGSSGSQNGGSDVPLITSEGTGGAARIGGRGEGEENVYPGPLALALIILGLCLSVFLISLDRTIITTVSVLSETNLPFAEQALTEVKAIPFITNEFNSPEDIGWYGSAYLLTASAFQPLYGRIFTLFNMKWSYLISLGLFLIGSLICGIAPNSITLIIGRAIAGLGSAGILTGSFVVVSHVMPLRKRPVWTAIVGLT
jgi:hypothetical protein